MLSLTNMLSDGPDKELLSKIYGLGSTYIEVFKYLLHAIEPCKFDKIANEIERDRETIYHSATGFEIVA